MDETTLNDLTKKIQNLARDFEHEQAANGTTIRMIVDVQDNQITVRTAATGGYVRSRSYEGMGENEGGKEMFIPSSGYIVPDDDQNQPLPVDKPLTPEQQAIDDFYRDALMQKRQTMVDAGLVYPIPDESGVNTADDLPLMPDEHTDDTDNIIVPPGMLETPSSDASIHGYQYTDAPGMTFHSPEDHEAWQRQQRRTRR